MGGKISNNFHIRYCLKCIQMVFCRFFPSQNDGIGMSLGGSGGFMRVLVCASVELALYGCLMDFFVSLFQRTIEDFPVFPMIVRRLTHFLCRGSAMEPVSDAFVWSLMW